MLRPMSHYSRGRIKGLIIYINQTDRLIRIHNIFSFLDPLLLMAERLGKQGHPGTRTRLYDEKPVKSPSCIILDNIWVVY